MRCSMQRPWTHERLVTGRHGGQCCVGRGCKCGLLEHEDCWFTGGPNCTHPKRHCYGTPGLVICLAMAIRSKGEKENGRHITSEAHTGIETGTCQMVSEVGCISFI
jgi:hypothetical protein